MTTFGRDISCTDGLRTGRYASGLRLVAEACYRRLITPRGTLRGGEAEKNYGTDLTAYVGKGDPNLVVAQLPGVIRSELMNDERVESVTATVAKVDLGGGLWSLSVNVAVQTAEGPFELQLSVDSVTVALVGFKGAA